MSFVFDPIEYTWEEDMIFIPHNVPSLKNSKVACSNGVFHSKTVKKYLQKIGVKEYRTRLSKEDIEKGRVKVENYVKRPNLFALSVGDYFKNVKYPLVVKFHFVRKTKTDFDFTNAVDIIADLLTAHEFIEDDCMRLFIPVPMRSDGRWYTVDKKNPGVYLKKVEV